MRASICACLCLREGVSMCVGVRAYDLLYVYLRFCVFGFVFASGRVSVCVSYMYMPVSRNI